MARLFDGPARHALARDHIRNGRRDASEFLEVLSDAKGRFGFDALWLSRASRSAVAKGPPERAFLGLEVD